MAGLTTDLPLIDAGLTVDIWMLSTDTCEGELG